MKRSNCYMPACGVEGKLCPDCASSPASVFDTYRDGYATGKTDEERRHYREPAEGEEPEWRDGYEAAWAEGFFARVDQRKAAPTLF